MPSTAPLYDAEEGADRLSRFRPSEATAKSGAWLSPALALRQDLDARLAAAEIEERWPISWTIAFVVCFCGAFWLGAYALIRPLIG